jgi:hypothetical protein
MLKPGPSSQQRTLLPVHAASQQQTLLPIHAMKSDGVLMMLCRYDNPVDNLEEYLNQMSPGQDVRKLCPQCFDSVKVCKRPLNADLLSCPSS